MSEKKITTSENMVLPDNRLSGETKLRQAQLGLLHLLKVFHKICKENNLDYWLDSGTLLGAVRDKGFIPWDDDIDVIMPFEHYKRFCKIAQDQLPNDVFFQSPETDIDYICPWVKLRDRYSHLEEAGGPYPYSQALSIDIFPVANVTERQSHHRFWYALLPPYNVKPERIVKHLPFISKCRVLVYSTFQWIFIGISNIPFIQKPLLKWFEQGNKAWEYLPPIRWKNRFPNEQVYPLKNIVFEDSEFLGPALPHEYLTDYYGDYMTPPPVEKRISEHAVTGIYPIGPNPHFSAKTWLLPDFNIDDITVIIPTYNSAKTIENCLNSITSQTKQPGSILIVDDGSTDNTIQICKAWFSNLSENLKNISNTTFNKQLPEFKIISQTNGGPSKARNTGIKAVNTKLTAFIDSDDTWEPSKIEQQLKIFNSYSNAVLVSTGSNLAKTTGKLLRVELRKLLYKNVIVTSSVMVKTDILKEFLFDESLIRSEDFNLWLKITVRNNGVYKLDKVLVNYNVSNPHSLSKNKIAFEKDELKNFSILRQRKLISLRMYLNAKIFSFLKFLRRLILVKK